MKSYLVILASVMLVLSTVGIAIALTETAGTTAGVTVNQFLSVTLSNTPVTFPSMDPGTGPTSATVGTGYPLTATIGAESNVNANVGTKADGANLCTDYPTCIGSTMVVSSMTWDDDAIGVGTGYTISNAQVCAAVTAGNGCDIYHQITVPSAQTAGTYSVGVTVTAISV